MDTQEARCLGRDLARLVAGGHTDSAYALLLPVLRNRTSFRLLDLIGQMVGSGPLESATDFAERVAADKTEGGWVVIGGVLREQLERDMPGALEKARGFILEGDVWYATDILAERVPGPALLLDLGRALEHLAPWRADADRRVRRTVGIAVHFWAKRTHGEAAHGAEAQELLSFLESLFEDRTTDVVKGVGWGLKTLGQYYPDAATAWLLRQTGRRPAALMLRKAVEYLPAEQRARVLEGFAR